MKIISIFIGLLDSLNILLIVLGYKFVFYNRVNENLGFLFYLGFFKELYFKIIIVVCFIFVKKMVC